MCEIVSSGLSDSESLTSSVNEILFPLGFTNDGQYAVFQIDLLLEFLFFITQDQFAVDDSRFDSALRENSCCGIR